MSGANMLKANQVLLKGKVTTVDPEFKIVEAAAIKNQCILAVGFTCIRYEVSSFIEDFRKNILKLHSAK